MTIKGKLMAATLAGLFSSAVPVIAFADANEAGKVKCEKQNSCNSANGCASKEVTFTKTAKECTDKGGKVVAANEKKAEPKPEQKK